MFESSPVAATRIHVTEFADKNPNTCHVLGRGTGPFLDMGVSQFTDPNIYVSRPGFDVLCQESGWAVPTERHAALLEEHERALARVTELEEEVRLKDQALGAVYALKQAGYVEGKKPGRPTKTAA